MVEVGQLFIELTPSLIGLVQASASLGVSDLIARWVVITTRGTACTVLP
jgi:hypothetical protein